MPVPGSDPVSRFGLQSRPAPASPRNSTSRTFPKYRGSSQAICGICSIFCLRQTWSCSCFLGPGLRSPVTFRYGLSDVCNKNERQLSKHLLHTSLTIGRSPGRVARMDARVLKQLRYIKPMGIPTHEAFECRLLTTQTTIFQKESNPNPNLKLHTSLKKSTAPSFHPLVHNTHTSTSNLSTCPPPPSPSLPSATTPRSPRPFAISFFQNMTVRFT